MSQVYTEPELTALLQRYEATCGALAAALCRAAGGAVITTPDATLTWMPVSYWANGVVSPHLATDTADRRLEELLAFYRARRTEMRLRLGPSTSPANLAEYLNRRGFRHPTSWPIMGADLTRLRTDVPGPSGLQVRVVDDYHRLAADRDSKLGAISTVRQRRLTRAFQNLAEQRPRRLWTLIGQMDGAPVAGAILFVHQDTATGYHLAVLPDYRRRGIGAVMMAEMTRLARDEGARYAVLSASGQGFRYYPRFGLAFLARVPVYRYDRALQRRDEERLGATAG